MPIAHSNCSVASPPQLDKGEEIWWKAPGSRQGQGEITYQFIIGKKIELGEKKKVEFITNQIRVG